MSPSALMLVAVAFAADPADGPVVGPPKLTRGDRIPYTGDVSDVADAHGRVTKRAYSLDVYLFVIDTSEAGTDCALFTQLTPKPDAAVIAAASNVMGTTPDGRSSTPIVRLDRVRIDDRGRVSRLVTPTRPPLFPTDVNAKVEPMPPLPLDQPPGPEWGLFVPIPDVPARVGVKWGVADGDRPVRSMTVVGTELRHGGRCFVVESAQQSAGWTDLARVATGWQRYDRLLVSPNDGLARTVDRVILHREGNLEVRRITVRYEARPAVPHAGKSYLDVRADVDTAVWLAAELDTLLAAGGKPDVAALARVRDRAARQAEDHPATAFRPALDAVRHRAEAALGGRALADGR